MRAGKNEACGLTLTAPLDFTSPQPLPTYYLSLYGCVPVAAAGKKGSIPTHMPSSHLGYSKSSLVTQASYLFINPSFLTVYLFAGYKPPWSMEGGSSQGMPSRSTSKLSVLWRVRVGCHVILQPLPLFRDLAAQSSVTFSGS